MIVNYEHYLETTKNDWFRGVLLINGIRRMEGLCASERLRAITLFDEKLKQWNSDNNANVPMMQNDVHMKGIAEAYVASDSPSAPNNNPLRKETQMTTSKTKTTKTTKTTPTAAPAQSATADDNAELVEAVRDKIQQAFREPGKLLFELEFKVKGKRVQLNGKIKSDDPVYFIDEIQALVSSVEGR